MELYQTSLFDDSTFIKDDCPFLNKLPDSYQLDPTISLSRHRYPTVHNALLTAGFSDWIDSQNNICCKAETMQQAFTLMYEAYREFKIKSRMEINYDGSQIVVVFFTYIPIDEKIETPKGTSGVYLITNLINGKKYIGKAQDLVARWADYHKEEGRTGSSPRRHISSAIRKHKLQNFRFDVLDILPNDDSLLTKVEKARIAEYDTFKDDPLCTGGYNDTPGGDGVTVSAVGTQFLLVFRFGFLRHAVLIFARVSSLGVTSSLLRFVKKTH
jgi:hypothetical protein